MINTIVNNSTQPMASTTRDTNADTIQPKSPGQQTAKLGLQATQKPSANAAEPAELQQAVSKLVDYTQNIQRTLSFTIEEQTGTTVVRVFDSETDELIRQMPAEETIKLAASIDEHMASLFLNEQA